MSENRIIHDRRAVRFGSVPGAPSTPTPRRVVVVGGGIAGLAAACGLVERGIAVDLIEAEPQLGGRVRAWDKENAAGKVTMSRGFHAFFRQYYNLRKLLTRAGNLGEILRPVNDYPVVSARGDQDSFTKIPRTPPWNFITFVMRSPTFSAGDLKHVDVDTALSLLDVSFPDTYRQLDDVSAAEFLDRLKFPDRARHLALEVFARSFFADPREFSAGELVAMFHSYFLGSAEGLLFDVPADDFETSLWGPLGEALERNGMRQVRGEVQRVERIPGTAGWRAILADGTELDADAVVLAAGPLATQQIIAASPDLRTGPDAPGWFESVERTRLAPPFAVQRLWFDGLVAPERPPFLGTAEFGPLDNVSVLERFEAGAAKWSRSNGGSVIELHAYALPEEWQGDAEQERQLAERLRAELGRIYPETLEMNVIAEEFLVERDCALIGTNSWQDRPEVRTPHREVMLAGDWVRCELPIALMERAATTGWMAANELLTAWGIESHELWSVPTQGRHWWAGAARKGLRRLQEARNR